MEKKITYTESELVLLIKQNNKAGFSYLYNNYAPGLIFSIKNIIADNHTAEDILQDVFVNIWTKIETFDCKKSCFYTWMHTIARNKAIDFTRGNVQKMRGKTLGNEDCLASAIHCTEQKTDKIGLNNLVTKLPMSCKDLVCLVYYSGHTIKEISANLDIPMGTVKTRLRRAIGILRSEFANAE